MRLYDRAVHSPHFHESIRDCVLVDVENVYEYYLGHGDPDLTKMEGLGGAIIPPFSLMWLEYPAAISITDGTRESARVAVWVESEFIEREVHVKAIVVMAFMGRFLEVGSFAYKCTLDGRFIEEVTWGAPSDVEAVIGEAWTESVTHRAISTMLLTVSFLHCKNVAMVDAPPAGTRQQRRAAQRQGVRETQFKTLVIEPMKQVLRTEGGIEQHGLKKALHICRGHFATYTEDKPLFGKYTGTFWRPAHVRGSADVGTVYKDYKVKP